jgi:hypothetical protein
VIDWALSTHPHFHIVRQRFYLVIVLNARQPSDANIQAETRRRQQ